MRKILILLLSGFVMLSVTGCGNNKSDREVFAPDYETTMITTTSTSEISTTTTTAVTKTTTKNNKNSNSTTKTTIITKSSGSSTKTTTTKKQTTTTKSSCAVKEKEVQYKDFSVCTYHAIMDYPDPAIRNTSCVEIVCNGELLGYKIVVFYY